MLLTKADDIARVWEEAYAKGLQAGTDAKPTPMAVANRDHSGNIVGILEIVDDGPCGMAWVKIAGTTPFARWLKKHGFSQKSLTGGHVIYCNEFGQSLERKLAWAHAVADHLVSNGVFAIVCQHSD